MTVANLKSELVLFEVLMMSQQVLAVVVCVGAKL